MNKKNSNWKWNALVIAATVAAAAAPAAAQGVALKATIPFAFSINKAVANLAPGNYVVSRDQYVWRFRNEDTNQSVAIVNLSGRQGKADEQPSLTFECLGNNCRLRAIHVGGDELGADVPAPQRSVSDRAEIALVSVTLKPIRD
jgi:hypothetical protein